MKKVILTLLLSSLALADSSTLSTQQVQEAIKKGTTIIDIRRPEEWKQYGIIEGSHKITFFDAVGNYDVNAWMAQFAQVVKDRNQPVILVCAHANRTKVVGKFLDEQVKMKNVYDLEGGINYGWIDKGLPTLKD